jgi:hypothetical protein
VRKQSYICLHSNKEGLKRKVPKVIQFSSFSARDFLSNFPFSKQCTKDRHRQSPLFKIGIALVIPFYCFRDCKKFAFSYKWLGAFGHNVHRYIGQHRGYRKFREGTKGGGFPLDFQQKGGAPLNLDRLKR